MRIKMMESKPMDKEPARPIILIKSRTPKRKIKKGGKRAKNQAQNWDNPQSKEKDSCKIRLKLTKEVTMATNPKSEPSTITFCPKNGSKPAIASVEVASPEIPTTTKAKRR